MPYNDAFIYICFSSVTALFIGGILHVDRVWWAKIPLGYGMLNLLILAVLAWTTLLSR